MFVGMTQMNPPVGDLCELIYCAMTLVTNARYLVPRMTPILHNRHEEVQEASINLIDRTGEYQSYIFFLLL